MYSSIHPHHQAGLTPARSQLPNPPHAPLRIKGTLCGIDPNKPPPSLPQCLLQQLPDKPLMRNSPPLRALLYALEQSLGHAQIDLR